MNILDFLVKIPDPSFLVHISFHQVSVYEVSPSGHFISVSTEQGPVLLQTSAGYASVSEALSQFLILIYF